MMDPSPTREPINEQGNKIFERKLTARLEKIKAHCQ
jgi:hypothetical protein